MVSEMVGFVAISRRNESCGMTSAVPLPCGTGRQKGALSGEEAQFADELSGCVDDDELLGLVVPNNFDLPFDQDVEVPPRLAGTVEHVSCCQLASLTELRELLRDVRWEDGEPPV